MMYCSSRNRRHFIKPLLWRRRSLGLLCLVGLCSLMFISIKQENFEVTEKSVSDNEWNNHHQTLVGSLFIPSSTEDVPPSDYEKYALLRQNYESKMATIPRLQYKTRDHFITQWKPVGEVQPEGRRGIVKRILQWTNHFNISKWLPDRETLRCRKKKVCRISFNKSDLAVSDAVIMHSYNLGHYGEQPPSVRLPHQRWVHFTMEGPYKASVDFRKYDNFYNWTVSYRDDSDIQHTYFKTKERTSKLTLAEFWEEFKEMYVSKPNLIAHMNSNCETSNTNRLAYVRELAKYIPVDRYGRCGNLSCVKNSPDCTETMKKYKFYMAMENSNCRDYITEKVQQPLYEWGSVPVVMGGAEPTDYEKLLPQNSYIHTSGFDSPKDLAEYLLLLDKHPALYAQYHRWRMTQRIGGSDFLCEICTRLYNYSLPCQTYHDFRGWYNQDTCLT